MRWWRTHGTCIYNAKHEKQKKNTGKDFTLKVNDFLLAQMGFTLQDETCQERTRETSVVEKRAKQDLAPDGYWAKEWDCDEETLV